jgi:hypothetical protein
MEKTKKKKRTARGEDKNESNKTKEEQKEEGN